MYTCLQTLNFNEGPRKFYRSHDSLSMSRQSVNAHPQYGHGPQQALPQSPYGPSPLPTADSMVISWANAKRKMR